MVKLGTVCEGSWQYQALTHHSSVRGFDPAANKLSTLERTLFRKKLEFLIVKNVPAVVPRANQIGTQPFARLAHPADLSRRVADDQRISRYIAGNDGACADHRIRPDIVAANYRAICPERCTFADVSWRKLVLAFDMCTRCKYICEYHRRTAKHILVKGHALIDGNIILEFAAITDRNIGACHNVLPDRAVTADDGARQNMRKVPYLGSVANAGSRINHSRFMNKYVFADIRH